MYTKPLNTSNLLLAVSDELKKIESNLTDGIALPGFIISPGVYADDPHQQAKLKASCGFIFTMSKSFAEVGNN